MARDLVFPKDNYFPARVVELQVGWLGSPTAKQGPMHLLQSSGVPAYQCCPQLQQWKDHDLIPKDYCQDTEVQEQGYLFLNCCKTWIFPVQRDFKRNMYPVGTTRNGGGIKGGKSVLILLFIPEEKKFLLMAIDSFSISSTLVNRNSKSYRNSNPL